MQAVRRLSDHVSEKQRQIAGGCWNKFVRLWFRCCYLKLFSRCSQRGFWPDGQQRLKHRLKHPAAHTCDRVALITVQNSSAVFDMMLNKDRPCQQLSTTPLPGLKSQLGFPEQSTDSQCPSKAWTKYTGDWLISLETQVCDDSPGTAVALSAVISFHSRSCQRWNKSSSSWAHMWWIYPACCRCWTCW